MGETMKNAFFKFTIILITLLLLTNCNKKLDMEKIENTVNIVKNKYAPDKRVALFDIKTEVNENNIILQGETNLKDGIDELTEELIKLNYNVKNEVKLLPNKDLCEKVFGIVNLSVANIRSKPNHPAELATQSLLGTCVNVLKNEDGWYLVQTPDKYISWVDDDGVELVTEEEQKLWKNSEKVLISEQYTIAYENADVKSKKISDLVIGDILKKIKKKGSFVKIEFPDGRIGFVKNEHTTNYSNWAETSIASESTILNTASNFMGLPYLWGGTSAKGVDCSGFTKTVYYLNGVLLPRDASQQVHVGELVDTKDDFDKLEKGDLLFFGRKASSDEKEKITHVAIYIGDYKYIHSAGRVKINSFDKDANDFNKYRLNTFIRARRIIGNYAQGENLVKNNPFYN